MMHTDALYDEIMNLLEGHGATNWRTEEAVRAAIESVDTSDQTLEDFLS